VCRRVEERTPKALCPISGILTSSGRLTTFGPRATGGANAVVATGQPLLQGAPPFSFTEQWETLRRALLIPSGLFQIRTAFVALTSTSFAATRTTPRADGTLAPKIPPEHSSH
jgi:hypothetical protein